MKKHLLIKVTALLLVCCAMLGCGKEDNPCSGISSIIDSIFGLPISIK